MYQNFILLTSFYSSLFFSTHQSSSSLSTHPHPSRGLILIFHYSFLSFSTHPYFSVLILIFEYSSLSFNTHPHPSLLILILHYSSSCFRTHPYSSVLILFLQYSSLSLSTHPYPPETILILQYSSSSHNLFISLQLPTHSNSVIYLLSHSFFPRIIHLCSPNLSYFPYLLILTPF